MKRYIEEKMLKKINQQNQNFWSTILEPTLQTVAMIYVYKLFRSHIDLFLDSLGCLDFEAAAIRLAE